MLRAQDHNHGSLHLSVASLGVLGCMELRHIALAALSESNATGNSTRKLRSSKRAEVWGIFGNPT